MPNCTTAHWTDGKGIGKHLTGSDLTDRLNLLADQATAAHREVQLGLRGMLKHAHLAGEALLEAKRRLGHAKHWSKWRYRELIEPGIMSKSTSCVYMQVARHWNDENMKVAQTGSISHFLRALRTTTSPRDRSIKDFRIAEVQKEMRKRLQGLSENQLYNLLANFRECWAALYGKIPTRPKVSAKRWMMRDV